MGTCSSKASAVASPPPSRHNTAAAGSSPPPLQPWHYEAKNASSSTSSDSNATSESETASNATSESANTPVSSSVQERTPLRSILKSTLPTEEITLNASAKSVGWHDLDELEQKGNDGRHPCIIDDTSNVDKTQVEERNNNDEKGGDVKEHVSSRTSDWSDAETPGEHSVESSSYNEDNDPSYSGYALGDFQCKSHRCDLLVYED